MEYVFQLERLFSKLWRRDPEIWTCVWSSYAEARWPALHRRSKEVRVVRDLRMRDRVKRLPVGAVPASNDYHIIFFFTYRSRVSISAIRIGPNMTLNKYGKRPIVFFKKMCQSQSLFNLFSSFQTHITIFSTNFCENMSIQYTVLGFELTTFVTRVSLLNH